MKSKSLTKEQRFRIIENILLKLNERLIIVEELMVEQGFIEKDVTKDEK